MPMDKGGKARRPKNTGDTEYVSAESRKRRTRHVIWDLEAQVEELEKGIGNLQKEHEQLTRKLAFMQKLVVVREDQAERLKRYGTSDPSNMPPALPLDLVESLPRSCSQPWRSSCDPMDFAMIDSTSSSGGLRHTPSFSSAQGESGMPSILQHTSSVSAVVQPSTSSNPATAVATALANAAQALSAATLPRMPSKSQSTLLRGLSSVSITATVRQPQDFLQVLGSMSSPTALRTQAPKIEQVVESDIVGWSEAQILDVYKQISHTLSLLLYTADDHTNADADVAISQVHDVVDKVRQLGAIGKICNPRTPVVFSKPVSPGIEPPTDAHWDAVVCALRLNEDQIQEVLLLNGIRERCLHQMHRDHAVVTAALNEAQSEMAAHWRVSYDEEQVRKAEMMVKVHRVINANRWLLVLVDEVLTLNILDSMQFARLMVHSFPYFPDGSALVEAVVRLVKKRTAPTSS